MIGLLCGFALAQTQHETIIPALAIAGVTSIAAVAPDLDLRLGIKHRGITHTLIAFALVVVACAWIPERFWLYIPLGYASHLIADMLTVRGIPLAYPVMRVRIRLMRLRTGGAVDRMIRIAAALAFLYLVSKSSF